MERLEDRRVLAQYGFEVNLFNDEGGAPGAPLSGDQVAAGETFFVEIAVTDLRESPQGIRGLGLDIRWDPRYLEEVDEVFDAAENTDLLTSAFPLFRTGTLDNAAGEIKNLSGTSFVFSDLGRRIAIDGAERFALLKYRAVAPTDGTAIQMDIGVGGLANVPLAPYSRADLDFETQFVRVAPETVETALIETPPTETPPTETPPTETPPTETAAVETPPVETAPTETASTETAPAETASTETAPTETPPTETPPTETPPTETPPTETPPTETAPIETPPTETAPTEAPPIETAPVEAPPAAETAARFENANEPPDRHQQFSICRLDDSQPDDTPEAPEVAPPNPGAIASIGISLPLPDEVWLKELSTPLRDEFAAAVDQLFSDLERLEELLLLASKTPF